MDAFFAAVEQLDHPEWRGRPVIVGGSPEGRGVVSTASYEARRYGVRSAMPSSRAARLCPDAVWAPARFDRYRELSLAVRAIFTAVTPHVQPVSIDEAFLDVTPTSHRDPDPVAVARDIQSRVDALGLSCSVGVSTSKTVAKIASDFDKPHGITVVRPGEEAAFLAPLPAATLSGIGGATSRRLREIGIRTLGDLAALDEALAGQTLGSWGPELVRRARGIDTSPVRPEREVKSVSHEHTFAHDVRDRGEVEASVRSLATRVAARLRRHGLAGRTVTVKLRYADFTTKTASRTLDTATDLDGVIADAAVALLRATWTPGAGLRLLGVGVSGFGERVRQLGLLDEDPVADDARERALAQSLDAVRERFGTASITFGTEVPAPHDPADGAEDGS
jgi:DNA polymerase-4